MGRLGGELVGRIGLLTAACLGACESSSIGAFSGGAGDGAEAGAGSSVAPACSRVLEGDEINVITQEDVESMRDVGRVEGNLFIAVGPPEDNRASTVTDLEPLGCLTEVQGELIIAANDLLTSLNGLSHLERVTSLRISRNEMLADTSALSGLQASWVLIQLNPKLTRLGLTLAGHLDGLDVNRNPLLATLEGLEQVTTVDHLTLSDNPALTSLAGLDQVSSVGDLTIESNERLDSLNGLERLGEIHGPLGIGANPSLTSLRGLAQLAAVDGPVRVVDNPALPTCEIAWLKERLTEATDVDERGNDDEGTCAP